MKRGIIGSIYNGLTTSHLRMPNDKQAGLTTSHLMTDIEKRGLTTSHLRLPTGNQQSGQQPAQAPSQGTQTPSTKSKG